MDRPELKAALDYIRAEDTLVVWKLDRLAHSLKQLHRNCRGDGRQGDGFKSLTENIDTTTSSGRLAFHIFALLAEIERSIIRECTKAGLDAAKARRKRGGRPPSLTEKDIQAAKAMLADPEITVEEVAANP